MKSRVDHRSSTHVWVLVPPGNELGSRAPFTYDERAALGLAGILPAAGRGFPTAPHTRRYTFRFLAALPPMSVLVNDEPVALAQVAALLHQVQPLFSSLVPEAQLQDEALRYAKAVAAHSTDGLGPRRAVA